SIEGVIPVNEQALRLSPRDNEVGLWYFRIGLAHLLQSRVDEAILWLEKARSAEPAFANHRTVLAAAYGLNGKRELAAAELIEARKLDGDARLSSIARLKARGWFGMAPGFFGTPKTRALFEATVFSGLRTAGIPET